MAFYKAPKSSDTVDYSQEEIGSSLMLADTGSPFFIPAAIFANRAVTWSAFLVNNLLPVTLGNIVGGTGFVALIYWWVYLKK